jgi:hypothetical protein
MPLPPYPPPPAPTPDSVPAVPDDAVPIETLFYRDAGPHIVSASGGGAPTERRRSITPRGSSLQALLESGLAGLTPLDSVPLSQPAEIEYEAVPIEELLYRGRSAIDRAVELRHEISARGGAPTPEEVEELFDLLELAIAD